MKTLLPALLCLAISAHADSLQPLDDQEMAHIAGQAGQGMQLTLMLRNNVDASGNPIGCTSGGLNPCRMGFELSARDGIWLMLKDYYGELQINDLRIDNATLPASNTSHYDASRFLSVEGDCLIAGCNPTGLLSLRTRYPFHKDVGIYNDLNLFTNIGRVALEYDDTVNNIPGYMRDAATGSVLGFRASDSQALNAPANMRFEGEAYVFGF
ncbi:hypothetical protein MWU49_14180 [Alcanivorax sp. S6407]|uniref:hypothetical protein n=1 Tax=Alcanivorax sp. S6407 TaxID=2926424 RepID=UPI001FF4C28C|nr:hypothetical protein [Alcanivorax sp. S6407]MCK0154865.1 hypothetical protein [Alcanivorax sp. S6407]